MTSQKQLLLVDDDNDLRTALAEQLASAEEEFVTTEADNAAAALTSVKDNPTGFDLLILDVGLPDQDGRELCRRLRRSGVKAPIIMLTAADTDADTILGLEAGANDYVSKPFRFPVLLARIRAQLRQHELSEDATFALGPYSFKPSAKLLVNNETERKTRLTEKETAILKYLKRADGRAVSREQLLDEVWGYNAGVNTHTLETHIYRLRQKIEDDPSNPQILVTDGGGYRLGV
jgi:DNA-binding response OmpR family regulator